MNKKALVGAFAVVVAAIAVWFFVLRGHGTPAKPVDSAGSGSAGVAEKSDGPKKDAPEAKGHRGAALRWQLDEDREGPLRLEGQVVDASGDGVKGAKVTLDSVPSRTATTEDDGSFSFDKLIGRTYDLVAESSDMVGGPVEVKLSDKSDPVVIHLAAGASVNVTVVDEKDVPLKGATVRHGDHVATTDDKGVALVKPVRPGWVDVVASKDGYAPTPGYATVGASGTTGEIRVILRKGFAVSGIVLDDKGAPLAKVKVRPRGDAWFGATGESDSQAVSDDKGKFEIKALASGAHTLEANDGDHAPAQSAPFVITDKAVTGISITMKPGAVVAGTVSTTDGKPAPFAVVRIAEKSQRAWGGGARQVSCDDKGAFEMRGLAQHAVQVRAENDLAASKIVDVDLEKTPEKKDVALVLDVSGTISGIVVDETGKPVPEVQVNAFPDLLGGGKTEGLALGGFSSTTTDGGGGFSVHGLPDGPYKVWAVRENRGGFGEWGQHGISAKTGDKSLKITLPANGELKGKIVLDGSPTPPTPAYVVIAESPATPIDKDGTFDLKDTDSGSFDITFRGPGFSTLVQRDVKIDPGKTTDMGTITVFRGRKLTGKVVDNTGAPVAGAKVKVGDMLFSSENQDAQLDTVEEAYGVRSAITDADGAFSIIGVSKKGSTAAAEHPDRGRSAPISLPAGTDDLPPVTLALRGFGSIAGKVTMQGKPVGGATVSQTIKGSQGFQMTVAQTADDGSFVMAKVPEGEIVLQAMQAKMMAMKATTQNTTVVAGKQTNVTIDIPVGTITLTVNIVAKPNNQVDAAQVFLFSGTVAFATGKELNDGFGQGGAQGMKFWLGKGMNMPEFDELVAGTYSACVIPITGSLSDPKMQQRIQENVSTLAVYCQTINVAPSPNTQSATASVPAMTPLPGD
ncbi:MAG TPA: carboxypeptidase-like regulatory domain-containing protein [Kofleriaceae bacterium]|jgi:uncharacterized GH25 family protein